MKPFLLVSCDGHIIDISGFCTATTSDAAMLKTLVNNKGGCFNSYFQHVWDVFVLDSGFRDVLQVLESYVQSTYTANEKSKRLSNDNSSIQQLATCYYLSLGNRSHKW